VRAHQSNRTPRLDRSPTSGDYDTEQSMTLQQRFAAGITLVFLGTVPLLGFPQQDQNPSPRTKQQKPDAANRLTIEVTGGEDDKPVENASVYVKYVESHLLKDKKFELNVKTNRDGVAHVPDAPLGRVLIQVVADGWKTYGRWYDVTDAKQIFKLHLERPPKWY
jgi:hypothetical protein